MKRQRKRRPPVWKLMVRVPEKNGVERVRIARKKYSNRMYGGDGGAKVRWMAPLILLCTCLTAVAAANSEREAIAAPEEVASDREGTVLVEEFPWGSSQRPRDISFDQEKNRPGGGGKSLAVSVSAPTLVPAQEETTARAGNTYTFLDVFEATGYCSCDKCCGVKPEKLTKSGTVPRASYTVAADPEVLPLGTRIMIDGVVYLVEDTGKAIKGNIVDIFFDSHEEALEFGRQHKEVYLVE